MGQVKAESSLTIPASQEKVFAAVADYRETRPAILSEHYRDYKVLEGGAGSGTVAQWTLQATESRSRNVKASVVADGSTVTEKDANSSLVTVWQVVPASGGPSGSEAAKVTVTTTWNGAGGVKGIFEGIFAPLGLKKIQAEVLDNLAKRLAG
ncbi:Polyketide cyclase/dehydrase [Segniliparus rotundus DSM 44985]|uniref:Polyketide cyclase/dehydrase n=1 Tax=Segniliparus rotundus (strain ATCC BAA-972 / CDC 1076 / CIP 108378 / DSM 44985 / JCM 13578) TaxID=640132 RepID=D6ZFE4_SEGRD|nr:SRPBCC family protein [Segniliparus rotundus]ADG97668.1 Polyketide cyclase/dehydrase [Segniliparus rotundus DSM 44985]